MNNELSAEQKKQIAAITRQAISVLSPLSRPYLWTEDELVEFALSTLSPLKPKFDHEAFAASMLQVAG